MRVPMSRIVLFVLALTMFAGCDPSRDYPNFPLRPALVFPIDGVEVPVLNPPFRWQPEQNAILYEVFVNGQSVCTAEVSDPLNPPSECIPPTPLPAVNNNSWFLRTYDYLRGFDTDSADFVIQDLFPPEIEITSPAAGEVVLAPFTITGNALDQFGMQSVELFFDATGDVGCDVPSDVSIASDFQPWSHTVAPGELSEGRHVVDVVACDINGNGFRRQRSFGVDAVSSEFFQSGRTLGFSCLCHGGQGDLCTHNGGTNTIEVCNGDGIGPFGGGDFRETSNTGCGYYVAIPQEQDFEISLTVSLVGPAPNATYIFGIFEDFTDPSSEFYAMRSGTGTDGFRTWSMAARSENGASTVLSQGIGAELVQDYVVRVRRTGSAYELSLSADGNTFTPLVLPAGGTSIGPNSTMRHLGLLGGSLPANICVSFDAITIRLL